jgi:hypothetical protein
MKNNFKLPKYRVTRRVVTNDGPGRIIKIQNHKGNYFYLVELDRDLFSDQMKEAEMHVYFETDIRYEQG